MMRLACSSVSGLHVLPGDFWFWSNHIFEEHSLRIPLPPHVCPCSCAPCTSWMGTASAGTTSWGSTCLGPSLASGSCFPAS